MDVAKAYSEGADDLLVKVYTKNTGSVECHGRQLTEVAKVARRLGRSREAWLAWLDRSLLVAMARKRKNSARLEKAEGKRARLLEQVRRRLDERVRASPVGGAAAVRDEEAWRLDELREEALSPAGGWSCTEPGCTRGARTQRVPTQEYERASEGASGATAPSRTPGTLSIAFRGALLPQAAPASDWPHSRSRSPPGALPHRVDRVSAYYRSGLGLLAAGPVRRNLTPVG